MKKFLFSFIIVLSLAMAASCGKPYENIEICYNCTMSYHGWEIVTYNEEAKKAVDALIVEIDADFAKFERVFTYVGSGNTMEEVVKDADEYIAPALAGSRVNAEELYAKWKDRFATLDIMAVVRLTNVKYVFECIKGQGTAKDNENFPDLYYSCMQE